jgi:hypothetical protein
LTQQTQQAQQPIGIVQNQQPKQPPKVYPKRINLMEDDDLSYISVITPGESE